MRPVLCLIAAALITACSSAPVAVDGSPGASANLDLSPVTANHKGSALPANWHKDAVFMQIYVRGYKDSDGDGVGDFKGLTEQLDYLEWLGIKGIWLMPMMASQDRDHGYAVTDYRSVEPDYGSMEDFKTFLAEAHQRGIGVIIDYVINHSAKQNPLFIDSDLSRAGKRDWYVWTHNNLNWPNWSNDNVWRPGTNGNYYAVFWEQMPDFNLRNDEVISFHKNNLRHWLNMGIDGFRFDAVGTLIENGKGEIFNQPENAEVMLQMRQAMAEFDNRYLICEMPDDSGLAASEKFCGSAFNFPMRAAILGSARFGRAKSTLISGYDNVHTEKMGMFLANHDGFAGDRVMVQLGGNEGRYRTAAATYLLSAGVPYIYYGEEIGMTHSVGHGVQYKDHALRGPMSWSADTITAGFTNGKPFRAPATNVSSHNVESQQSQDHSLLQAYRGLIALRNSEPALRHGSQRSVPVNNDKIYAFTRSAEGDELLVVINYSDSPQPLSIQVLNTGNWQTLSDSPAASAALMLPPLSYHVWKRQ